MRIVLFLIALLFAGNVVAQSQQPESPQPAKVIHQQAHPPKTDQKPENDQRGTEKSPIIIKVLPTKEMEDAAKQAQREHQEKAELDGKLTEYTKDLAIFTEVLAGAAILQLIVFSLQAWKLHQTVKATKESADAALKTAKNMEVAERAYVKMSHTEPGMLIHENETVRMCDVTVKVENCGKTPATVTDVRLNAALLEWGAPLPETPNYGQEYPHGAPFLVPGDFFFWGPRTFPLGHLDFPNPGAGSVRLCLFGYVDYADAFGCRHRAGYAREYRAVKGSNLFFITEPGYNYDRPRKPGEGNDWDGPKT